MGLAAQVQAQVAAAVESALVGERAERRAMAEELADARRAVRQQREAIETLVAGAKC